MVIKKCHLTKEQINAINENDKRYKVIDDNFICRCNDLDVGRAIYCYRHGKNRDDILNEISDALFDQGM